MSWLSWAANGLGTLIGVVAQTVEIVVREIRSGYETFRARGGTTGATAREEKSRRDDRLREVNDEIMTLRDKVRRQGQSDDSTRRSWEELRREREELIRRQDTAREVSAAEKVMENEDDIEKVVITGENVHIITANAFADIVNKICPKCGRKMKLQWGRHLSSPEVDDLFWGCSGWYFHNGGRRKCTYMKKLDPSDRALMVDASLPEFETSADDFATIISMPDVQRIVTERMNDLDADLRRRKSGVEIATCPIHGEALRLRKKTFNSGGLMDTYFLGCPYWEPNNQGCNFIEKLKSASQLAVLLKAETGTGIL